MEGKNFNPDEVFIVVSSGRGKDKAHEDKAHGQTLKNILSASGKYTAALWTTADYTHNEPQLSSTQKVIFIGENDVSKRNFASIEWKFEAPNMKYGWIGSVAVLTVGNTLLSELEWKDFIQMFTTQTVTIKSGKFKGGIAAAAAAVLFGVGLWWLSLPIPIIVGVVRNKKLARQRKGQYDYLIRQFVLNDIDSFLENKT